MKTVGAALRLDAKSYVAVSTVEQASVRGHRKAESALTKHKARMPFHLQNGPKGVSAPKSVSQFKVGILNKGLFSRQSLSSKIMEGNGWGQSVAAMVVGGKVTGARVRFSRATRNNISVRD